MRRSGYTAHKWIAPQAALELAHAGPMRKAMTLLGVTDETSAWAARETNEVIGRDDEGGDFADLFGDEAKPIDRGPDRVETRAKPSIRNKRSSG